MQQSRKDLGQMNMIMNCTRKSDQLTCNDIESV